ncbi:MAG: hypothetical protein LBU32_03685 [Clostridiales bacterium]|nr:hypothetical protein [Clostridiales bacterium]
MRTGRGSGEHFPATRGRRGFIFGRRSSRGLRRALYGGKISAGISFKKLNPLARRTAIQAEGKGGGFLSVPKGGGSAA